MKAFIKKYFYELLLFVVVALLFLANYEPGTVLSGWDNLQTELNPGLAVKRAFHAVWEEYQSFGLVSGMAHAADLVRATFLWMISFILPQNLIRYFFHHLMLFLGALGSFKLFAYISEKATGGAKKGIPTARNEVSTGGNEFAAGPVAHGLEIFAFLGSLFYLLNIGTIQIFALPFEPFSVFFAALPWEIWIFLRLMDQRKFISKNLLWFLLINLLSTPQAYIQTLFLVYMLILGTFALGHFIRTRSIDVLKRASILAALIVLINSFWLLPQIYFLKTSRSVVAEAKSNQIENKDIFFLNREKGTLHNFVKLEGFYFDLFDAKNNYIFAPWKEHFSNPFFSGIRYLFVAVFILGIIKGLGFSHLPFLIGLSICAVALLSATPPFSWLNNLVRESPLVSQIFRSPFTKFVVPLALIYSYFFTQGLRFIYSILTGSAKRGVPTARNEVSTGGNEFAAGPVKISNVNFALIVSILIFLYSLPAFQGHFLAKEMKIKIPDDYKQVIEYFKKEDKSKRIALLPDYTFWGWFFHRWGYNGSGFLWYGIEQPIVSRTFDMWSNRSESYFWEMKNAIVLEDLSRIENLLDKYAVDYFLFDKSLLPVVGSQRSLQYDRLGEMLARSRKLKPRYEGRYVTLYEVRGRIPRDGFIATAKKLPNIGPAIKVTNDDNAYLTHGAYKTDYSSAFDLYFPFLDLTAQSKTQHENWKIKESNNKIVLERKLDFNPADYNILRRVFKEEYVIGDEALVTDGNKIEIGLDNDKLIASLDKNLIKEFKPNETVINDCNPYKTNFANKNFGDNLIVKSESGAIACFEYEIAQAEQKNGYLLKVENENLKGRDLYFYISDLTKKQTYLETRLLSETEYFIINPQYEYGVGYAFNFYNNSYKNLESVNKIKDLTLYTFPYNEVKSIEFVRKNRALDRAKFSSDFKARKVNYYKYKVYPGDNKNIILYQAYNPGWIAFPVQSSKHFSVNNWANGWSFDFAQDKENEVTIVFWPQYLEYLGLVAIAFTFLLSGGLYLVFGRDGIKG